MNDLCSVHMAAVHSASGRYLLLLLLLAGARRGGGAIGGNSMCGLSDLVNR